ncbi:hypothetical protein [Moritella viscosa]|uniref:Uncharacterized protein n=1 Tax=Moritella viscosa TaxID=80854 RepID=A0A090IKW4_9GAMM|nr:hypothetical protein [Moritella viscosa]CED60939.1 putative uncharacterized protein [Moritella viscosa]SGY95633.1 Putative uncharacterized protein [Moritella viscosa]SGZ01117.1 Putative uncharacterized protein [Moritella viscosa]SGZ01545.1 Putative uncharacterized protein [Moritella viscosa]SGZ07710.1 Putative uncharacterized protein [Moritella viscosa]
MSEHLLAGFSFGSGVNEYLGSDKTLSDRVGVAGTGIDLATHILDSTPVGALLNMAVEKIDERGIAQLERTKTIQSIKAKFSGKISRVVAQKMHASTMAKGTKHLANVHSEQNFMDKSKEAFDKHQVGMSHKIKRKLHDQFHADTKTPMKFLMIPLGFIPDGGITKAAVSSLQYLGNKTLDARKGRKKNGYSAGNLSVLEKQMGKREAQRKIAKWSAKDIGELGPKLQRNLHKLKQSVALLESREQIMNAHAQANSSMGLNPLSRSHMENLGMSFYETKHYIEKVSDMCKVMEQTALEVRTHMVFLDELLKQTELAIRANASSIYK